MNFELFILNIAVWTFIAHKFAKWSWVMAITGKFPGVLASLWKGWTSCAFCGGFWLALLLRSITGWQTLPALGELHFILDWIFDGLVTAMFTIGVSLPMELISSKVILMHEDKERALERLLNT